MSVKAMLGRAFPKAKKTGIKIYNDILDIRDDFRAGRRMKEYENARREERKNRDFPVRVGFVVQMPAVWDKQASLFRFMLEDSRFEPRIIYVNHYDFVRKKISDADDRDAVFYENLYGTDRVIRYAEQESFRLKDFDYLFYDRPYNHFLPEALRTGSAARETGVCIVNYCTRDLERKFMFRSFARYASMWFACNHEEYLLVRRIYGRKKTNRIYDAGYPAFEYYHSLPTTPGKNRILWTPRWTYDSEIGGCHFFEYINPMIDYASRNDVHLTIRPHPLMFENLLSKKAITEEEIARLKQRCADAGIAFDTHPSIADTFRETDILVTDYSSIIGLFMATGKPIVYCATDLRFTPWFSVILDAAYRADSWDQIAQTTDRLLRGDDPLSSRRQKTIQNHLLAQPSPSRAIAEIICNDFRSISQ